MPEAEPPVEPQTPPADDAEAAAVWSRLAPHAKKSFTEALDEYFIDAADAAEPEPGGEDGRPGGPTAAGGTGDTGAGGETKARPKAQSQGPDLGREISEFFFGKQRK